MRIFYYQEMERASIKYADFRKKSRNVYAIKLPLTEQIILKALSEIDII